LVADLGPLTLAPRQTHYTTALEKHNEIFAIDAHSTPLRTRVVTPLATIVVSPVWFSEQVADGGRCGTLESATINHSVSQSLPIRKLPTDLSRIWRFPQSFVEPEALTVGLTFTPASCQDSSSEQG
jgi:hypothetical protein